MTINEQEYREMYRVMRRIRAFENAAAELWEEGEIHGELHLANGHEAVAAGISAHLREEDSVAATHRAHNAAIAKGVDIKPMLAEILGRETGLSRGKGGHMHLFDPETNFGCSGIIGAGLPLSLGPGLAADLEGTDAVSVAYLGEGAANQGSFHESLNMASVWDLPVIFVIEDDKWAVSMTKGETTAVDSNTDRAIGQDMPGLSVNGMNPRDVSATAGYAVQRARNGAGPTLIEAECYHYSGHFEALPQEALAPDELEEWRERDPLPQARQELRDEFGVSEDDLDAIDSEVRDEVDEAVEFALDSPLPDAEVGLENVFAEEGSV
jgi:TPP-dependent pyruvate/acetoin dehydrogenase alpha subunit